MVNLKQKLAYIKSVFFPHWDRQGIWRIRSWSWRNDNSGYCDKGQKIIEIVEVFDDPEKNDGLLIHEICHAVVKRKGHEKEWRDRMKKAARKARQIGRRRLAEYLEEDAKPGVPTDLRDDVVDLMMAFPNWDFDTLMRNLANKRGLLTADFSNSQRREIKKAYEEAKTWAAT